MKNSENSKIRFNIINLIIYIVGIIFIIRLFDFQIIHGEEYRQLSNNSLTRELVVIPTRGNILDRTGNLIAGNTMGFELQMYKSKVDVQTLNRGILNLINLLEKNSDKYIDTFPIKVNPFEYTITGESLENWKKENSFLQDLSAEEIFYKFAKKYEIENTDVTEIRKIITVRYRMQKEGYSSTSPLIISKNISRQSVIEINENNTDYPGVDVVRNSISIMAKR